MNGFIYSLQPNPWQVSQGITMARIGQFYQWAELPGKGYGYVRFKHGDVVCANLKPELNPDAPKAILVGKGIFRELWARILCEQNQKKSFEVYLKRGTNKWEFVGFFIVESWSESRDEIQRHEEKSKRKDVARVIYLRKA